MIKKKVQLNSQVKILYGVLCAVSLLVLYLLPSSVVQSWDIYDFWKLDLYVTDIAGGFWYIGLIGLIISVILVFIGYGVLSFSGYLVYMVAMLIYIRNLFWGKGNINYDDYGFHSFPVEGGYISLVLFAGVSIMSIIILKKSLSDKSPVIKNNTKVISNADELLKYKQLLDEGVITQEEFEKKKKDLIGL